MFSKISRLTLAIALLASSAIAQNFTAVSGSKMQDAGGNLLANGQICFIGTDQNDQVISYQVGGGGQVAKTAVCSTIAAGVITGFNVANPGTTSPAGILYRITVVDNTTGQEVLRYKIASFSGATFNFDNFVPLIGSVNAPSAGSCSAPCSVAGNLLVTGQGTFGSIPTPGPIGATTPNTIAGTTISLTGKAITYNNITTAGPGVTPVLWIVGLTAQTATIGTTNITTTCPAGMYSFSYYLKTTTAGTGGTASLTLNWNDGVAMTTTTSTASLTVTTGVIQGTQVLKCGASTTVSYATTVAGATGSPQYSLDISGEQVK